MLNSCSKPWSISRSGKRIAVVMISLAGLSACVPPSKKMTNKFDLAEHARFRNSGKASISGQAFLRQQGGGVVRCAGEEVVLVPATPFFREITDTFKSRAVPENMKELRESYQPVSRKTFCDADGKFRFDNIPSGDWFISTKVQWIVGGVPQGGLLQSEVKTSAVGEVVVLLTDRDILWGM